MESNTNNSSQEEKSIHETNLLLSNVLTMAENENGVHFTKDSILICVIRKHLESFEHDYFSEI